MIFFHVLVHVDEQCEVGAWAAVNQACGGIALGVLGDDMLLQRPLVFAGPISFLITVWNLSWVQAYFFVLFCDWRASDKNGQYLVQPCRSAHVHLELTDGASIGQLQIMLIG